VITGGYHCGFVDTPSFGGLGCDSGSIPKATQLAITRRKLVVFFETYLRGNAAVWSDTWGASMQGDAAVQTTFDAGSFVRLALRRRAGVPGSSVVFYGSIGNSSTSPESYDLFAEGVAWPLTFAASTTAVCPPGGSVPFRLRVTIPAGTLPTLAPIVISARSTSDGGTRCYANIAVGVR
jgi:hypothetical protein